MLVSCRRGQQYVIGKAHFLSRKLESRGSGKRRHQSGVGSGIVWLIVWEVLNPEAGGVRG
jgi:hypothetical protein